MSGYFIRRLLNVIPMLFGITLLTFFVVQLSPGKPAEVGDFSPRISHEARERLRKLYGLDRPIHIRYFDWLRRIVLLDFGNSFKDNRPAIEKIAERLPATLLLNILSLFFIFALAIPLGVFSAIKHNTLYDKVISFIVFLGYSMPTFWLALLAIIFFGLKLGWLPISGLRSLNYEFLSPVGRVVDIAMHLVLPVIVTAFTGMASITRYSRNGMLEALRKDYVRFAKAKGVPERRVIYVHALRNALLPIITIVGLALPGLIGGSFIFETIFAYPGMGRLGFEAIMARDYPVIMAISVIVAVLTLIGNLLADFSYSLADPRIRYR